MVRAPRAFWTFAALVAVVCSCEPACPSPAGGSCDPASANCPKGYLCAVAQVCTKDCAQASDCWVKVEDGCRSAALPGQRLPDGGTFVETSEDGFCPETRLMACVGGHCQRGECADGGCDYDVWGPSPFAGNRTGGPAQ